MIADAAGLALQHHLPCAGRARRKALHHRSGSGSIAELQISIRESHAEARFAARTRLQRLVDERLSLGNAAELEQDERSMLGNQRGEQIAGRHRVECSEGTRLILRIRRDPGLQERPDEAEVARFRALLEECEGPTAVV